ncbi:hypothetical protein GCM10027217_19460 [Pseudomaricurvus hydrocarbonicus]
MHEVVHSGNDVNRDQFAHRVAIAPQNGNNRRRFAMVALSGPLAMISCELRQARKGATVAVSSCAGVWLV